LTRELCHRGFKVTGVDVSKSAVKTASSLTTVPTLELFYKQMDVEKDDVADLPFQPYGLITCKLVYAFIHNKQAFFAKVISLLDNKGIFVVIMPLLDQVSTEKRKNAVGLEEIELLRQNLQKLLGLKRVDSAILLVLQSYNRVVP
jgi:protein-L-isoaspartate(D-aspartate) O-methyltransferase